MYFLKRLAFTIPILLVVSMLAFALVRIPKGGPFDRERKPASPEIERNLQAKYHLDEPIWKQYLRYVGLIWERDERGEWHHAAAGFNTSLRYRNHSVLDVIKIGLPVSLTIGLLSFCFAMAIGLPLGFVAAARRGQWQDHLGNLLALLSVCIPGLVVAPLLALLFGIKWRLLPVALWDSPLNAVMPVIALGLFYSGRVARLMREGMLGVLPAEFITTARAKGLSDIQLLLKHGLRLAILPVVSYSGPMLADLLTGSFIVESVFQLPGLGVFLVNSLYNSDYTMTVGLVLLYAVVLLGLNLLADLLHAWLDPRIKYE
jgi:oligopeptide transport system permease protein